MTTEDQKFLTALVEQGTLDRDLLKARGGVLETSMREKGMARALLSTFNLTEEHYCRYPEQNICTGKDDHCRRDRDGSGTAPHGR